MSKLRLSPQCDGENKKSNPRPRHRNLWYERPSARGQQKDRQVPWTTLRSKHTEKLSSKSKGGGQFCTELRSRIKPSITPSQSRRQVSRRAAARTVQKASKRNRLMTMPESEHLVSHTRQKTRHKIPSCNRQCCNLFISMQTCFSPVEIDQPTMLNTRDFCGEGDTQST